MLWGHGHDRLSSEAFSVWALPRVREGFGYNAFGPTFGAFAVAAEAVKDWVWISTAITPEVSTNAVAYRENIPLILSVPGPHFFARLLVFAH